MSRGKQISGERRNDIINDYLNRICKKTIAEKYSLSISTICKTISRYESTGSNDDKPRSGRPKVTSARQDAMMVREIKKNSRITAANLSQMVAEVSSIPVSPSTIRRRLHEKDFHGRRPRKVPGLSKKNIQKRYLFALEHKNHDTQYWNSVIWSDESKFDTRNDNCRRLIWRQPGKELQKGVTCHSFKSGNLTQMVWGCFKGHKLGPLHFIDGIMDRHVYLAILEEKMLPFYNELVFYLIILLCNIVNYSSDFSIFQQDNDPKHTSLTVRSWFQEKSIYKMEWPSQSPDLNPIEHVWARMKSKIQGRIFRNKGELKSERTDLWYKIEPTFLKELVASMPRRITAVIKAKGGATKY